MKKGIFLFFISIILVSLAACGGNNDSDNNQADQNEDDESLTINHEMGETEVKKNPENVVVFDNGVMDTLDELDIDITGVPQANLPSYLDKYESDDYINAGAPKEPDFEGVAEADPDVIFISGRQADVYDELEKIAPTIFLGVDDERYMDSFEENMDIVGEIFDKEEEVDEKLESIEDGVDDVKEQAENLKKKATILMYDGDGISVFGPGSRFGLIHDVFDIPAQDENIEDSTHGETVSFEYVKDQDPDMLYVVDKSYIKKDDSDEDTPATEVIENELLEDSTAYENDDIYYLDPEYWYQSGGGLVSMEKMIEEISESLDEVE